MKHSFLVNYNEVARIDDDDNKFYILKGEDFLEVNANEFKNWLDEFTKYDTEKSKKLQLIYDYLEEVI